MNQRTAVLSLQLLLGGTVYADDTMVSTSTGQFFLVLSFRFPAGTVRMVSICWLDRYRNDVLLGPGLQIRFRMDPT